MFRNLRFKTPEEYTSWNVRERAMYFCGKGEERVGEVIALLGIHDELRRIGDILEDGQEKEPS